jgi:uncharacterized repeat protein (TIGR03803 family)
MNNLRRLLQTGLRAAKNAALAFLSLICLPVALGTPEAEAQIFEVLHTFTGSPDGGYPNASLMRDETGNLYGTTPFGGTSDNGTVFKLDANDKFIVLYSFRGGTDGVEPLAPVIKDSDNNLYGTTFGGGANGCPTFGAPQGCGTIFKVDASGNETVLYRFKDGPTGARSAAPLLRDAAGHLFGTTVGVDINHTAGTAYELTPKRTLTVLHAFTEGSDGGIVWSGLVPDAAGDLYGTAQVGGVKKCHGFDVIGPVSCGVVFKLSHSNSGWVETVVHAFTGKDGSAPRSGLVRDAEGNLYGTTPAGGSLACFGGCGVIFRLNPQNRLTVLHRFSNTNGPFAPSPSGLVRDAAGNLYGTTQYGGGGNCLLDGRRGCGTVFKLDKQLKLTVLHSFTGRHDGRYPVAGLVLDAKGDLYGTTQNGGDLNCGTFGCGTVFRLTP